MWIKMVQERTKNSSYGPSQVPRVVATLEGGKYNNGTGLSRHIFFVIH